MSGEGTLPADGSFAAYPASITELRSDRSRLPSDSKPRDALIKVLRDLDAGVIDPDHIVIILGKKLGLESRTIYHQAGTFDFHAQLGLMTRAVQMLPDLSRVR